MLTTRSMTSSLTFVIDKGVHVAESARIGTIGAADPVPPGPAHEAGRTDRHVRHRSRRRRHECR